VGDLEALAKALERKRAHYNALFAEARQRNLELEPADLVLHLKGRVAPIFAALPELSPEAQDRVLDVLYKASLELLTRRLLGNQARGSINRVWEALLPRVAPLIAVAPRRVVAALSNAAFNLDQELSARPEQWLASMVAVAPHCSDLETLVAAGQVAAWRAGLPQFRTNALALCGAFSPELCALLLAGADTAQIPVGVNAIERLQSRRFVYPNGDGLALTLLGSLGGFSGFGGQFSTPPTLLQVDGTLIAQDHESAWEVHADCFGALLRRRPSGVIEQTKPRARSNAGQGGLQLSVDGQVSAGDLTAHFPQFEAAAHFVSDAELLLVVPARSHVVALVAVTQGWRC
jgi:hypothetical protein